jgi:hypothetical protein
MDDAVRRALDRGGICDITTTGRRSGSPRRLEIYFHNIDGTFYITGRPGFPRDWMANLHADPRFTLHLKRGVAADLVAVATPIGDEAARRSILYRIRTESWGGAPDEVAASMDAWAESAPLVSFRLA